MKQLSFNKQHLVDGVLCRYFPRLYIKIFVFILSYYYALNNFIVRSTSIVVFFFFFNKCISKCISVLITMVTVSLADFELILTQQLSLTHLFNYLTRLSFRLTHTLAVLSVLNRTVLITYIEYRKIGNI